MDSNTLEELIKEEAEKRYSELINVERNTARNQRKNQRIFIEGANFALKQSIEREEQLKQRVKELETKMKEISQFIDYSEYPPEQILDEIENITAKALNP